jgi:Xaa-Pro aminopeptidase
LPFFKGLTVVSENVGENFKPDLIEKCRDRTWELVYAIAKEVRPGQTEKDLEELSKAIFTEFGVEKKWHPSKLRIGVNTLKSFREISEPDVVLKENDLFFIDIGPVFFGHEGDCGKTFSIGNNKEHKDVILASEEIYNEVKICWKETGKSGADLYEFAKSCAKKRGYLMTLTGASGHRIGDFPHAIHHKGLLSNFNDKPTSQRWILEIQIRHPEKPFGAFYEDMLS